MSVKRAIGATSILRGTTIHAGMMEAGIRPEGGRAADWLAGARFADAQWLARPDGDHTPASFAWATGDADLDAALNLAGLNGHAAIAQMSAVTRLQARLQGGEPVVPVHAERTLARVLAAAVQALYLADNSDYGSALWSIIRKVDPAMVEMLARSPGEAQAECRRMLAALADD
ncbi:MULTISPECIES: hypothetical protein [Achromobacter]|uniref:hypothetical protein n=1 Tax=Achromobacter TaxID=222 RepID=UPI0023F63FAA|nr:hypothetical protein [Achromobacter anxifer]MDF8363311.1 hypothetical protein [Achromobacter anxifer]